MSTGETDRYMDGWAAGRQQAERERCTGKAGRPFWQETPSPTWCTARHRDGDEPGDRNHHVREREPLLHLGERELRGFHLTIHEAEKLRDHLTDLITPGTGSVSTLTGGVPATPTKPGDARTRLALQRAGRPVEHRIVSPL